MQIEKTISLIGAGALGLRYLQGIHALPKVYTIRLFVVDVLDASLVRAKKFYEELQPARQNIEVIYLDKLLNLPKDIDLTIVSTTADVRGGILKSLNGCNINMKSLLLEKLIAQNYDALQDDIWARFDRDGVYVNTPRRIMGLYSAFNEMISNAPGSIKMTVTGGNWGLACNGIHFIDLFEWLAGDRIVSLATALEKSVWVESKRAGFSELTGLVSGKTGNGDTLTLESTLNHRHVQVSFETEQGTWDIDELSGEVKGPAGSINLERTQYLSEYTPRLIAELLETQRCNLPSFGTSFAQHKMYLRALQSDWKANNPSDSCMRVT